MSDALLERPEEQAADGQAEEGRKKESGDEVSALYEADYHAWALDQARRLRAGEAIDTENIAEELESLGGSEEQQLVNRLAFLLAHMLKWEFQPDKRSRSWPATMNEQRKRVARLLKKMPSLRSKLDESIVDAYDIAVTFASVETAILEEDFPKECPYSEEEILTGAERPGLK